MIKRLICESAGIRSIARILQIGVNTIVSAANGDAFAQGQLLGMLPGVYGGVKTVRAIKANIRVSNEPNGSGGSTSQQTTAVHGGNANAAEPNRGVQKLLPNSTSKVAPAEQKLANAATGAQGESVFIVSENGTTISNSQSRMILSFDNAGFTSFQIQSPGVGFTMPNGVVVRAMQPSGPAP